MGKREGESGTRGLRGAWARWEWWGVAGLGLAALGLGVLGFRQVTGTLGNERSDWDVLYLALQLFFLESGSVSGPKPWQLEVARFLAPGVAAYATVRTIAVLFRAEIERLRIRSRRNHVVVCGLGRMGFPLASKLHDQGERVTVIEQDGENEMIEAARSRRIPVLVGDARSPELLRVCGARRARRLIAVTGDDGVNVDIVLQARSLAQERKRGSLACLAHMVERRLYEDLRLQEIRRAAAEGSRLDFFNVYRNGAVALLAERPVVPRWRGSGPREARILIVGLGQFGSSVVVEAARWCRDGGMGEVGRLAVTVVDRNAEWLVEALKRSDPLLDGVVRDGMVRIEPKEMTLDSPSFAEARFAFDGEDEPDLSAAYVCIDNDSASLRAGLVLHDRLRSHVPVVVRMAHGSGLAAHVDDLSRNGLSGLYVFPLLDRVCAPQLLSATTYEILARAIHEADLMEHHSRSAGDRGTPAHMIAWVKLPEEVKEWKLKQAEHLGEDLEAVGYEPVPPGASDASDADRIELTPRDVELLAEKVHARRRREGDGELGEELREQDRALVRNLPWILGRAGFEIRRIPGTGTSGQAGRGELRRSRRRGVVLGAGS